MLIYLRFAHSFFFFKTVLGTQRPKSSHHLQKSCASQQNSFIDSFPPFEDLGESYKCLHRSVYDNSQGFYHFYPFFYLLYFFIIFFICCSLKPNFFLSAAIFKNFIKFSVSCHILSVCILKGDILLNFCRSLLMNFM